MITSGEAKQQIRARKRKRWALGMNTLAAVSLLLVLVAMINYLSFRHYLRKDLSRTHYYTLSDKTLSLLDSLEEPVKVIVFFQREQEVFEDVENLFKEYEYASNRIDVEYVDPDRDLARTEELAARYEVNQANVVVFDAGERSKYITADDIYEFEYEDVGLIRGASRVSFRGEQVFSTAIHELVQGTKPVVYVLGGHGERDIDNTDRSSGLSGLARLIRRDNIEVRKLVLGEQKEIPADCDAIILAGPKVKISQPELDLLAAYLEGDGRAIVLLDALTESGLDPILARWGVRLEKDLVVDGSRTLTGRELFVTEYEEHPITENLAGFSSVFYLPRSVVPIEPEEGASADQPRAVALATSSEAGWAEYSVTQNPLKFDPEVDRPGPVPVVVAVERGPGPDVEVEIRPTRLVVFGDADFVGNAVLRNGDSDFFMSALNWVLEREELMAIAPKSIEESRLIMDEAQLRSLFWLVVAGLPGIVALLGGLIWVARRS